MDGINIIIIIIIIIKNEKIRVTLCENAAGALYIVNKMCVEKCGRVKQVNVMSNRLFVFSGKCQGTGLTCSLFCLQICTN